MTRPRLLDLFCGAGGCSVGYDRAGFDVVGVDIEPHPDYPFTFHLGDALTWPLDGYDVVHASPPCPRYSVSMTAHPGKRDEHPDLVPPIQQKLRAWGGTYVIENVPGAPLDGPVLYCGWAMGLKHLRRHRLFESNVWLMSPGCACPHGDSVSVFGHSGEDRRKQTRLTRPGPVGRNVLPFKDAKRIMGIDWMTKRHDLSDAIPPAYTEHIGLQLLDHLAREASQWS